jgi:hypothetical protein
MPVAARARCARRRRWIDLSTRAAPLLEALARVSEEPAAASAASDQRGTEVRDWPSGARIATDTRTPQRGTTHTHAAVHLHHEGPPQGHAAGEGNPQGHLALLLCRRQDRCARRQRRGQEHAAAHHGRRREGLRRRSVSRRRDEHRLSAAGAAARSVEERAAARRRSRRADTRAADALRGSLHAARRTDV